MEIEFVKSKMAGRIGVQTRTYNADFVEELRRMVPSAKWSGTMWFFGESAKSQVVAIIEKYWPDESAANYQNVRISWNLVRDQPRIDGAGLAYVSQGSWSWWPECPIKFTVIVNEAKSGGSIKNPVLNGRLVIEARIRIGARISPNAEEVEILP